MALAYFWGISPLLIFPGAVAATVAELLPLPWDDNLTVPLIAAAVMAVCAGA